MVDHDSQATASEVSVVGPARIGLFGGTFDPIHFGHLRSAVELAERYTLTTLYLLPNHRPAHRGPTAACTDNRIAMLELAIRQAPHLAVDGREALRETPSYTLDTLRELHTEQPEATLVFFMGLDAFAAFDTWHDWEEILNMSNLVVVNRPEAEHSLFSTQLLQRQRLRCGHRIRDGHAGAIEICDVSQLSISATDIRRRIAQNRSVRFLLPESVVEYIEKRNLYRGSDRDNEPEH